jgi:hypothetical protein
MNVPIAGLLLIRRAGKEADVTKLSYNFGRTKKQLPTLPAQICNVPDIAQQQESGIIYTSKKLQSLSGAVGWHAIGVRFSSGKGKLKNGWLFVALGGSVILAAIARTIAVQGTTHLEDTYISASHVQSLHASQGQSLQINSDFIHCSLAT